MRSQTADALRAETRRRVLAMTPDERIQLALSLGDADLAALCQARNLTPAEGRSILAATRRHGRRPSRSNDA